MDYKEEFSKRLIQLREQKGFTQQQLADSIGITRQSLSLYEKAERTINFELLAKIADFFNVSTDYLMGRTDVASMNEDLQTACKVTGLSESAVIAIRNIHDGDPYRKLKRDRMYNAEILEKIILSESFPNILSRISSIKNLESTLPDDRLTLECTAPNSNGLKLTLTKKDFVEYDLQFGMDEFKNIIKEIIREASEHGEHNPEKK